MTQTLTVAEAERLLELLRSVDGKATLGPWRPDRIGHQEGCPRVTAYAGAMDIADIRGWGYLTGQGGLNKHTDDAIDEQGGNMEAIVMWRAVFGGLLEYLSEWLAQDKSIIEYGIGPAELKALAPAILWADENFPGWRER